MSDKDKERLKKRCLLYIRENLRAPSMRVVKQWGKRFGMSLEDIQEVNQNLLIRYQLGNKRQTIRYVICNIQSVCIYKDLIVEG